MSLLQQVIVGLYDFRGYSFQIQEFSTTSKYPVPLNSIFAKSFPGPGFQHCDSYYRVNYQLLTGNYYKFCKHGYVWTNAINVFLGESLCQAELNSKLGL